MNNQISQESFNPSPVHESIRKQQSQTPKKSINPNTKNPSALNQFFQRQSTVRALQYLIVILFIVFVLKLCFSKKGRDPRIIRGRGGSVTISSKRVLRTGSQKSNHRHGMPTVRNYGFDEDFKSSSSEDSDE